MAWTIDLAPETERRLEQEAARRGQDPRELVQALLEEKLASLSDDAIEGGLALFAGQPRATPEEVQAFLRAQKAKPVERIEELQGDFWPEDESLDDFLKARHQWQWEGNPGFPRHPLDKTAPGSSPK